MNYNINNRILLGIVWLLFGGLVIQCAVEGDKSMREKNNATSATQAEMLDDVNKSDDQQGTDTSSEVDRDTQTTKSEMDATGNSGEPVEYTSKAQEYFDTVVKPLFYDTCSECHTLPVNQPVLKGPVTIYSYSSMKAMLLSGDTPVDNDLFQKIRNSSIAGHEGGDQCAVKGLQNPLCANIIEWWMQENPNSTDFKLLTGFLGYLDSLTGIVKGWAANDLDHEETVSVKLYVKDGEVLNEIGETLANQDGFDNSYAGNHAFEFQIPSEFKTGKSFELVAKVNGDVTLDGSPRSFIAYEFSQEGRDFYNNSIRPKLTGCGGCHGNVGYEDRYYALISPHPDDGGTPENNRIIKKLTGNNHKVFCSSPDASPCSLIKDWWNIEFGP